MLGLWRAAFDLSAASRTVREKAALCPHCARFGYSFVDNERHKDDYHSNRSMTTHNFKLLVDTVKAHTDLLAVLEARVAQMEQGK